MKAPRFVSADGDACELRFLLEDIVVVLIYVFVLRIKTFVCSGLGNGDALRRFPS